MDNLVRAYDYAMQRAQSLQQRQHDLQATFFGLLKTDPQAAANFAVSGELQAIRNQESMLKQDFSRLGLAMAVQDGKIVAVNDIGWKHRRITDPWP